MAALCAAVCPLSAKNRRGEHFLPPPPSSARVNIVHFGMGTPFKHCRPSPSKAPLTDFPYHFFNVVTPLAARDKPLEAPFDCATALDSFIPSYTYCLIYCYLLTFLIYLCFYTGFTEYTRRFIHILYCYCIQYSMSRRHSSKKS